MPRIAPAILALVLAGCASAYGTGEPVYTGMTPAEVRERMGPPRILCGGEQSAVRGGVRYVVWNYSCWEGVAYTKVYFRNGEVVGWDDY